MLAAFPLQLLRNRVYSATLINDTMLGFAYIMIIYAVPMKLQVVNGKSALVAGIMLLPLLGGVAIGSPVAGFINKDKNRFCETIVVASCLMLLGCGLETTLSDSYHLQAKALGLLVLIGFGFGLSAAPTTMIAMFESPIHEHGMLQTRLTSRCAKTSKADMRKQLHLRASSPNSASSVALSASLHLQPSSRCRQKRRASHHTQSRAPRGRARRSGRSMQRPSPKTSGCARLLWALASWRPWVFIGAGAGR